MRSGGFSALCALYVGLRGIMAILGGCGGILGIVIDTLRFYQAAPLSSSSSHLSPFTPSLSCTLRVPHTPPTFPKKNPPQTALSALPSHLP